MTDTIAIIGLGSAGQRHARNALAMGLKVVGYDTRPATPELLRSLLPGMSIVTSLEYALETKPLGVIIATPPETHFSIATEIASLADLPCLIEKPIAVTSDQAEIIIQAFKGRAPLQVGYQLRFNPSLAFLQKHAATRQALHHLSAHVELFSSKWFSGNYAGDFLLECSHEIDYLRWLLGSPICLYTEEHDRDWFRVKFQFQKASAVLFMREVKRPSVRRGCVCIGFHGTWRFDQKENGDSYASELKDFIAVCRGEKAQPECTGEDGWWALRIVEAIKRSAETRQWESV